MAQKTSQLVEFQEILQKDDPQAAAIFRVLTDLHAALGDGVFDLMVKIIKTGGMVLDSDAPGFAEKIHHCLTRGSCPLKPTITAEGGELRIQE